MIFYGVFHPTAKCFGRLNFQRSIRFCFVNHIELSFFLFPRRSTLKNLFLLATSQHVIVGSIDSNRNQLQITYYAKQDGNQTYSSSVPWSFDFKQSQTQCKTLNNQIICANNDELSLITIPTTINDASVRTNQIKLSNTISDIKILSESNTRSVVSVKTNDGQTKLYQFNKKEGTIEWDYKELETQTQSNSLFSIVSNENLLEATAVEEKLNFYVSSIGDQGLTKKRSYSVELPENMGGIEYLSYSIVRNTQLATLRMADASLLAIKLTENGGR